MHNRFATTLLPALVLVLAAATAALAQTGAIAGRVTVAEGGGAAAGATIEARAADGTVAARATSSESGAYRLEPLAAGSYTVVVDLIGHRTETIEGVRVVAGNTTLQAIELVAQAFELNPLTVTASRRQEKVLEAPATVTVIDQREIRERPALTPTDHVRSTPGVDIANTGMMQSNIVARGFNNVFSSALLVLTDNRIASVPSLRVNVGYMIPSANEDIERIEVVLGPGAALYGPNSANGVMHVVTRSPFESEGTEISVAGGHRAASDATRKAAGLTETTSDQGLAQVAARHAGVLNDHWAYKISAQMLRGGDWRYYDKAEDNARRVALTAGADPDTLLIGARDFMLARYTGEARIDYRPDAQTEAIVSVGTNLADRAIEMTGIGAAQVHGWRYDYAQLRFRRDQLFAQAFVNTSNAGDTYLLRTGQPIADKSWMLVGQVQHSAELGSRQTFTYGLDYHHTVPRTSGSINGRNEDDDIITEWGGYLHSQTALSSAVDLVGAARIDFHNRLPDAVFSPRAAVVFNPVEGHNFRMTYNRAFATPTTNNLFLDIVAANILGTYDVRASGVPEDGFHFRRDCAGGIGGLCMRSPFSPDPSAYGPATATPYWDGLVALVGPDLESALGVDFSVIPAPGADQVSSVLKVLNTTTEVFNEVAPSEIRDVDPLEPTINNTIEVGYKGVYRDRIRFMADAYWERRNNFIGPLIVETPNVFYERGELQAYLAGFMSAAAAQTAGAVLSAVPVGTVTPDHTLTNSPDMVVTYRNFGEVDLWGGDVALEVLVADNYSFSGSYSYVSRDFFSKEEVGGVSDVALNAPQNKFTLTGRYRGDDEGTTAELRVRHVDGFPMNSGVYIGDVEGFNTVDVTLGYRLPLANDVRLTLSARNLLNQMHREFVGAPELGRVVVTRLQYSF